MAGVKSFEPETVTAGETITWRRELPEYPANEGWVLSYALVNEISQITFNASADGRAHVVQVPASESDGWSHGFYSWQAAVSKDDQRFVVGQGTITVRPNFAAAHDGLDARSQARRTLDALRDTLEGKASNDQLAISIRGRSISRMSASEVIKWLDFYEKQVAREESEERARRGMKSRRLIRYRIWN
jgi:hypothetical protein